MLMQTLGRWGGVCCLIVFVVGCTSSPPQRPTASQITPTGKIVRSDQCRFDPQSCMYEGPYEPNERAYAEQKAKELNKASAERLRRAGGGRSRAWW